MISAFRCSEDEKGLFEVIAYRSMAIDVILFKWLYLISLMVFSNVGSGLKKSASILLFILIYLKLLSNYAGILEISNFDRSLTCI